MNPYNYPRSDDPGGGSGGPMGGSGGPGGGPTAVYTTASCAFRAPIPPLAGFFFWDNYKGSPMLELWTARTRNLGEPQVPD